MGGFNDVRRRGATLLAWLSLVVAIAGGALAVGTFVGKTVAKFVEAIPWPWLPGVLLAAAFIATAIDIFIDGEPNQVAIYSVMAMPSLAASTGGGLARSVTNWSTGVLHWIDQDMSGWLGTSSSTGLAVGAIVAAILMSNRVVKKSAGRGGGRGGRVTVGVG